LLKFGGHWQLGEEAGSWEFGVWEERCQGKMVAGWEFEVESSKLGKLVVSC
jgi:hypothetical protein